MATIDVLKSRKIPIEAVVTRKAGSKFLMNLFYYFDRRKYFDNPLEIESCPNLRWSSPSSVLEEPEVIRVTLFRNPYDRFIAFYFESIFSNSPNSWTHWRSELREKGFDFDANSDVPKHRKNVDILLDYISEKIGRNGLYELPAQLAPQVKSVLPAQDIGFEAIKNSRVNIDLAERLKPHFRNIEKVMARIQAALAYDLPIDKLELLDVAQSRRISEIYAIDFDFFEAMRYGTT